jgi:hypothetical protein
MGELCLSSFSPNSVNDAEEEHKKKEKNRGTSTQKLSTVENFPMRKEEEEETKWGRNQGFLFSPREPGVPV